MSFWNSLFSWFVLNQCYYFLGGVHESLFKTWNLRKKTHKKPLRKEKRKKKKNLLIMNAKDGEKVDSLSFDIWRHIRYKL